MEGHGACRRFCCLVGCWCRYHTRDYRQSRALLIVLARSVKLSVDAAEDPPRPTDPVSTPCYNSCAMLKPSFRCVNAFTQAENRLVIFAMTATISASYSHVQVHGVCSLCNATTLMMNPIDSTITTKGSTFKPGDSSVYSPVHHNVSPSRQACCHRLAPLLRTPCIPARWQAYSSL